MHPTRQQTIALLSTQRLQCALYNAALEERIGVWKWEHRSVTYFDQCCTLTGLKDVRPEVVASGITLCRGTLKRLDHAYGAFHRRMRMGETPGFPRFKSSSRFDSLQWFDTSDWKLKVNHRRLYLKGIGEIKTNYHRPLLGDAKAIVIKREGTKWWLIVQSSNVPAMPLEPTGRAVGIDLGVINIVATSDGERVVSDRFGDIARQSLARAQRQLATKQRGSNRRRRQVEEVARLHRKVKNQRSNAAHQISRQIVNAYDFIALENLKIVNMVRAPKARPDSERPGAFLPNGANRKAGLNRSIHDAGWGQFVSLVSYKAESAGRTVVSVNPCFTSQTCAECHFVDAGNRVNQKEFRCLRCGHYAHADNNAARNILRAGRALQDRLALVKTMPLPLLLLTSPSDALSAH
ncbi:MAG TPA: transposase [Acidimicrobiales bacterium]|nr:transposase [Acidimicrobiales bacterium]